MKCENESVTPSFSHFFLKPLFFRGPAPEALSITTKIPLTCNLVLEHGKFLKMLIVHQHMLSSAEFAMTNLLSALLRLTAATCACWKSFSTFTHIACNVVSGRKLLLRHSVKHYEAISLNCCFISGCKDRCFYDIIATFVAKSLIFERKFGKTTANLEKCRIFVKK